jgi:hypothetical protein
MEREMTLEEVMEYMNKSQNECIIHVDFGLEEGADAKEEE